MNGQSKLAKQTGLFTISILYAVSTALGWFSVIIGALRYFISVKERLDTDYIDAETFSIETSALIWGGFLAIIIMSIVYPIIRNKLLSELEYMDKIDKCGSNNNYSNYSTTNSATYSNNTPTNTATNDSKSTDNSWVCSKCGMRNASLVGTCSNCGASLKK